MKLKAIAAVVALVSAAGAQAAAWDLSLADFDTQANFVAPVTFAGASAITYDFTFSGAPAIDVGLALAELKLSTVRDIEFTSIKLVDANNVVVWSQSPAPNTQTFAGISGLTITPSFSLVLEGKVVGTGVIKGSYSLAVAAVPVPEPETYAMMVAGLGLLGYVASRRRG